ncbi:hypothetical protein GCM10018987_19880 [Streptomyces cremeus]
MRPGLWVTPAGGSGQGRAAPYALAGSAAARTTARFGASPSVRSRAVAAARRRSTAPSMANWGRAEPLDHVTPAGLPAVLERGEDAVDRGEAARDALGGHRAARDDAVPVQEGTGQGVGAVGGVGLRGGQPGPAAGDRGRSRTGHGAGGAGEGAVTAAGDRAFRAVRRGPGGAARAEDGAQRGERVVGEAARPGQVHSASANCGSEASGWVVARTWSAIWRKKSP